MLTSSPSHPLTPATHTQTAHPRTCPPFPQSPPSPRLPVSPSPRLPSLASLSCAVFFVYLSVSLLCLCLSLSLSLSLPLSSLSLFSLSLSLSPPPPSLSLMLTRSLARVATRIRRRPPYSDCGGLDPRGVPYPSTSEQPHRFMSPSTLPRSRPASPTSCRILFGTTLGAG